MVDEKAREMLGKIGQVLADMSKLRSQSTLILPETREELGCLVSVIGRALITGKPMTLYTPLCPDWSRDENGRYDFKSLGGGESAIAKKVLKYSPDFLRILAKHSVPYRGLLIFADWGMETELNAKDQFGSKLSLEDVQMLFQSSIAKTDEHLLELQQKGPDRELFAPFSLVAMTDFLDETGLDLDQLDAKFRALFLKNAKGKKLFKKLVGGIEEINQERGITHEENSRQCLENLIDYAIFGQALASHGVIIGCESLTASKAYNLFRGADVKAPLVFVLGKGNDSAVNIG